jgi:hypothetical protein
MLISTKKSKSGDHKTGTWGPFSTASTSTASKKVIMVNLWFLAAFFTQMQYSDAETKPPILIDSKFTQPEKLQLRFHPMGKYAASTFTSHIRIPFNYSSLMDLQFKLDARLDQFLDDLREFNFEMDETTTATLKSTFQIYKQSTREIFKISTTFLPACHMFMNDTAANETLPLLWPQRRPSHLQHTTPSKFQNWRPPSKPRRPKQIF